MSRPYRIVPWDQIAGRATFTRGRAEIDAYWRTMAVRHAREGLAAVTVMEEATTGEVVGFYTMVSYTLVIETLPAHLNTKKLPRRLPTTLVGKSAVSADRQGQGLGAILLSHAIASAVDASTRIGLYAIVVDAIDDDAARFYGRFGFLPPRRRSVAPAAHVKGSNQPTLFQIATRERRQQRGRARDFDHGAVTSPTARTGRWRRPAARPSRG